MHPAPEPCALDMWSGAVEAPVPDLVTEPIEFPCGALFITMVSIVHAALAAVVMGEPHPQVCYNLALKSECFQGYWTTDIQKAELRIVRLQFLIATADFDD